MKPTPSFSYPTARPKRDINISLEMFFSVSRYPLFLLTEFADGKMIDLKTHFGRLLS